MPKSKKPRKQYSRKPVVIPFKPRDDWGLEGRTLAAMSTLDQGFISNDHLHELGSHAMITERIVKQLGNLPEHSHLKRHTANIIGICLDVLARPKGNIFCTECASLQASVSVTLPWLRKRSNFQIVRAAY